MGTVLRVSAREVSDLMVFAILIFATKSFAYEDPVGFISIDCGSVAQNSTDSQTQLLWVNDGDYIISGENGLIQDQKMSLVASDAENYEALKSFRYFPEKEMQSKYCYELPIRISNVSFLLRAMFLHGNSIEIGLPSLFHYYIDGSLLFTVNYTEASDVLIPEIVENIFFPPLNGSIINVCLVPIIGVPFISSLELREFDPKGIMYTTSFGNIMREGLSFTNLLRWNTGGPNMSTVRYPDDPYDRLWIPQDYHERTEGSNVSQQSWSQIGPEVNSVPYEVMRSAWINTKEITDKPWLNLTEHDIRVNIPHLEPEISTYGIFYFAILNESTKALFNGSTNHSSLTTNVGLDAMQYPSFEISTRPSQETFFHTVDTDHVGVQMQNPFVLNALEFYVQRSFSMPTTALHHVAALTRIKKMFNMTKWQGDPCAPIPYDWIGCYRGYDRGRYYYVTALTLSHLLNSSGLLELNADYGNWHLDELSITNSNIDSNLFQYLMGNLSHAPDLNSVNMSFNAIDTFPPGEWWIRARPNKTKYSLSTLDLTSNRLKRIPHFRDLPFCINLEVLNLSQNVLTGNFPNETYFSNLTNLKVINLSFNNLGGEIPLSLSPQNLPNSTILDIE